MKRDRTDTQRRKAAREGRKAARLEARNRELEAENAELKARIERLEELLAKAQKDSSTSSKPPSSDVVRPPRDRTAKRKRRKRGGQPGHPRHERPTFSPDQVDRVHHYRLRDCPCCGTRLVDGKEPARILQQVEIPKKPLDVHEHRSHAQWCPHCEKTVFAPFPADVRAAGLSGPGLTALVAYLKGVCHASFSTIRKFFRDVVGLKLSRGYLRKLVAKVSRALDGVYQELREVLPLEDVLNVDETGHKENGAKFWTWCFRAKQYTLFRIDKSRASAVLVDVLGKKFDGVLGCDYFSAYRKYMGDFNVRLQFCFAHLIRDIKFLKKLDSVSKNFGERLLAKIRALFRVIHRRESMTPERFQTQLENARVEILKVAKRAPQRTQAQNIARRFRKHGKSYFEFITTPGVEPTNNLAEQAIRFVVIDRKITQGTRGLSGRQWCERIWTTLATCAQQGRSIYDFLHEAVLAIFHGRSPPSLLPSPI